MDGEKYIQIQSIYQNNIYAKEESRKLALISVKDLYIMSISAVRYHQSANLIVMTG